METVASAPGTKVPLFYNWEIPGKSVIVQLSFAVIDRIRATAASGFESSRRAEIGGILLGTAQRGSKVVVRVEDCVPVPCDPLSGPLWAPKGEARQVMIEKLAYWEASPARSVYAVGFYRSHARDHVELRDEDLAMFSALFPDPAKIALVFKPELPGPGVAGFFFWEDGRVRGDESCLEFPFDRRLLGGGDPPAPARRRVPEPEAPRPPERPATAPARQELNLPSFLGAGTEPDIDDEPDGLWQSRWVRIAAVVIVIIGLLLVSLLAFKVELPAWPLGGDPYALNLEASEVGGNLHLTWNRQSGAVVRAARGVLIIGDGEQTRSMELDNQQLRYGSVIYHKLTGPVRFRLEVYLDGRRTLSESWEPPPSKNR